MPFTEKQLQVYQVAGAWYSCSWKPRYVWTSKEYPLPMPAGAEMVKLGVAPGGRELWANTAYMVPLVEDVKIPTVPQCSPGYWKMGVVDPYGRGFSANKEPEWVLRGDKHGILDVWEVTYSPVYYRYEGPSPTPPGLLGLAIHTTTDDPVKNQEGKIKALQEMGWMPVATCERWAEVYGYRIDPKTNKPYRLTMWAGEVCKEAAK